jgi:hypothetical protein
MQLDAVIGDNCDRIHRFILDLEYEPSACAKIVGRARGIKVAQQVSSQGPRPGGTACGLAARRSTEDRRDAASRRMCATKVRAGGQCGTPKLPVRDRLSALQRRMHPRMP